MKKTNLLSKAEMKKYAAVMEVVWYIAQWEMPVVMLVKVVDLFAAAPLPC
jgi:hypothetical protein